MADGGPDDATADARGESLDADGPGSDPHESVASAPAYPVRGDAPGAARIRRFEPGDEAAVVALHERALADAGTDPADVPGTRDLRWVPDAYLDPGGEFLVAEIPGSGASTGEIVGMGGLVVDGTVGELFRFAVHPDYQRGGLGSAVLDALERAARDRGVERLVLTTAQRQDAAVQFYAARGYAETGRRRHGEYELVQFAKDLDV